MKNFKNSVKYYLLEEEKINVKSLVKRIETGEEKESWFKTPEELDEWQKMIIELEKNIEVTRRKLNRLEKEQSNIIQPILNRLEKALETGSKNAKMAKEKIEERIVEAKKTGKKQAETAGIRTVDGSRSKATKAKIDNIDKLEASGREQITTWQVAANEYFSKKGNDPEIWKKLWTGLQRKTRASNNSKSEKRKGREHIEIPERTKWFIDFWSKVLKEKDLENIIPKRRILDVKEEPEEFLVDFLGVRVSKIGDEKLKELINLIQQSW